jgi:hypothetical protein
MAPRAKEQDPHQASALTPRADMHGNPVRRPGAKVGFDVGHGDSSGSAPREAARSPIYCWPSIL